MIWDFKIGLKIKMPHQKFLFCTLTSTIIKNQFEAGRQAADGTGNKCTGCIITSNSNSRCPQHKHSFQNSKKRFVGLTDDDF